MSDESQMPFHKVMELISRPAIVGEKGSSFDAPSGSVCNHDYNNAVRIGRAHYICPKCKQDITLMLVLMDEADRNV